MKLAKTIIAASALASTSAFGVVTTFDFSSLGNDFDGSTPKSVTNTDGYTFIVTETSTAAVNGVVYSGTQPQIYIQQTTNGDAAEITEATIQVLDSSDSPVVFSLQSVGTLLVQTTDTMVGQLNGNPVWTITNANAASVATSGIVGEVDEIIWTVGPSASQFGHVIRTSVTVDVVPEPSSVMLLGLSGLCLMRRRR